MDNHIKSLCIIKYVESISRINVTTGNICQKIPFFLVLSYRFVYLGYTLKNTQPILVGGFSRNPNSPKEKLAPNLLTICHAYFNRLSFPV